MSKYIYLGTDGDKVIFYNELKDEFYSAYEEYFSEDKEENIEIGDDRDKKEQAVLITNPDEIQALKAFYEAMRKHSIKEENLTKAIRELNKRDIREKKSRERRKKILFFYILVTFSLAVFSSEVHSLCNEAGKKFESLVDDYKASHQNDDIHLLKFYESIEENATMSQELKGTFKSIFSTIVLSDVYISDSEVNQISHRLKMFNFENYNISNYSRTLSYILFGKDNIISKCTSMSLSEYVDDRDLSEESIMFGMLNIEANDKLLTSIFAGEDEYINYLTKKYNTTEENIRELINLINAYHESRNSEKKLEIRDTFYQKLGNILLKYYQENVEYSELDYLVLSSQAFDDEFLIKNNIFSKNIAVTFNDPKYGKYDLWYNSETQEDYSFAIYCEKLADLINKKGNALDYNDSDARFLIYLVYLAREDSFMSQSEELAEVKTSDDLSLLIGYNVFYDRSGRVSIDPAFLYGYLSTGKLNISDIVDSMRVPKNNEDSIALFQTLDYCLRIELANKPDYYEEYSAKMAEILDYIQSDDEEFYNLLVNSLKNNTSPHYEFKLVPFSYDEIKSDTKEYTFK